MISKQMKMVLTLRISLSIHAKTYDPLGLVLPTRMIGNLLFRKSLQTIKKEQKENIPWNEELRENLVEDWQEYFKMLTQLHKIKFNRSLKPNDADPNKPPKLITFSDGNTDSYGTVAYNLWTLVDGTKVMNLVM